MRTCTDCEMEKENRSYHPLFLHLPSVPLEKFWHIFTLTHSSAVKLGILTRRRMVLADVYLGTLYRGSSSRPICTAAPLFTRTSPRPPTLKNDTN